MNTGKERGKKKGWLLIIAFAALVVISLTVILTANSAGRQWQKQIDLGQKYLEELDYEQAAACFLAAIEIEPKKSKAYLYTAEAYIGMGDREEASRILELGLERTDDAEIREMLEVVKAEIVREQAEEALKPVLEAWRRGDMEEVKKLIRQDGYFDRVQLLAEGESYYYGETDAEGSRNGIGVAVYGPFNPYYYLGEWKNGLREGSGDWVWAKSKEENYTTIDNKIYHCDWSEDYPEGNMVMWEEMEDGKLSKLEGTVSKGLFVKIRETEYDDNGDFDSYLDATYTDGYPEVIYEVNEKDDPYMASHPYVTAEGETRDGSYLYYPIDESMLNRIHGVAGFADYLGL